MEGVLIAAQVVGIDAVYIYLRDEYHECRAILTQADRRSAGRAVPELLPQTSCGAAPAPTSAARSRP
jgi:hypothetical protein